MGNRLSGKAAVVTGAGRGLGRAFALALAAEGASVVVNDLGTELDGTGATRSPADEVVAEITKAGGQAVANYDTVTTAEGGENIIQACLSSFGKIDILINNAGVLRDRMIFNMTPEEWDAVIKVHLYGTFNCTRPAASLMREQKSGRIISITSPTAFNGNPGQSNYGAAKAGILGFTRVIARELGGYGVTANAFCPVAATRMMDSPAMQKEGRPRTGRPEPEDNAAMVVFLASAAAAGINGQTFGYNGGRVSLYSASPEVVKSITRDGIWTFDDLLEAIPASFGDVLNNPPPYQEPGGG